MNKFLDWWEKNMWLSKKVMIIGSILLLGVFVFPLWSVKIAAPQYPVPLGMEIWVNKITDMNPNDLKNINLLNHYVGMKAIPEHIAEFDLFPAVIIFMSILGIIFGFIGKKNLYILWFSIMLILGFMGMYDFYLWEYDYGHDLSPKAAIKFTDPDGNPMVYQPPMFGKKDILNFTATSLPMLGAFIMFISIIMSFMAYILSGDRHIKIE